MRKSPLGILPTKPEIELGRAWLAFERHQLRGVLMDEVDFAAFVDAIRTTLIGQNDFERLV
jgi:hypothetical protein